jgi:transcription-repair coupling factor (superfamily II helicase)
MIETITEAIGASSASIIEAIRAGAALDSLGIRRSARLPLLASIYRKVNQPILLVTDRQDRALVLADELKFWLPQIQRSFFPEPTPLFYEDSPWGVTTRRDRLTVLGLLSAYHIPGSSRPEEPPIMVAPVRAVMTRTMPRRDFLRAIRTLKTGLVVSPDELLRSWVNMGYEPENVVVAPGQVARRGGILDIWVPAEPEPVRLEFFGDEIDALRKFDPASQRTIMPVDDLKITPAREYLSNTALSPDWYKQIRGSDDDTSIHEFFIPVFHPHPSSILDYLTRSMLVFLDDRAALRDAVNEIDEQAAEMRKEIIGDGALPETFPAPYLTWTEIEDAFTNRSVYDLGYQELVVQGSGEAGQDAIGLFEPGPRFGGRLRPAMDHFDEVLKDGDSVVIVSRQKSRLEELWKELTPTQRESAPVFLEGTLAEGWIFRPSTAGAIHLLTDGELFGWRRPEPRQRQRPVAETPEAAYADFQVGDWVVHVDHGIGRFVDLVERTVDDLEREYLCIEYAEGDQLFVPVYQADRLTRYVGPDSRIPSPSRLGSVEWRATKTKVKEAVEHVAEELLELYSQRQIVSGYTFDPDTPWQQELEASFPYVETEDQLRVIAEVKRDMENPRPMDRLICGDVGYGKTEVALRAAFKAVMAGKQVAILVPTTVLAQQHFYTFRDRLSAFPMEVEMLSRFRTPQQQREITTRLSDGAVDIVIGTHRLIQEDVQFKNLGLLIIDEEQRFGVMHKEKLKQMRTEVDVLTMTATPIPRTLYMALTGVRDISTINTPPEERLPIVTHVGPYSPRMVRQAILREMERGGQIFFVHNRVQTIQAMRGHLENIIPEAKIAVAHGQMPEQELAQRMEAFAEGEIDILLSTSIIESGLDIPNANTLIVDRADTFGLAQLYQLRGRVGRGAQRAYAYFFRHNRIPPTPEGRQRLETIAENIQLGAGFSIAMRDLEIRGTGDILGIRQHGHIAAVGFNLYTRLLADSVRRIRSKKPTAEKPVTQAERALALTQELRSPVTIDLPLSLGIPASYVTDRDTRLRLYRRLADLVSLPEIDALEAEFIDRFGPLPQPVRNLMYQLKIRVLAERVGLVTVAAEGKQIVLRYPPLPEGINERAIPDVSPNARTGKNAIWLAITPENDWQEQLLFVLNKLTGNIIEQNPGSTPGLTR